MGSGASARPACGSRPSAETARSAVHLTPCFAPHARAPGQRAADRYRHHKLACAPTPAPDKLARSNGGHGPTRGNGDTAASSPTAQAATKAHQRTTTRGHLARPKTKSCITRRARATPWSVNSSGVPCHVLALPCPPDSRARRRRPLAHGSLTNTAPYAHLMWSRQLRALQIVREAVSQP